MSRPQCGQVGRADGSDEVARAHSWFSSVAQADCLRRCRLMRRRTGSSAPPGHPARETFQRRGRSPGSRITIPAWPSRSLRSSDHGRPEFTADSCGGSFGRAPESTPNSSSPARITSPQEPWPENLGRSDTVGQCAAFVMKYCYTICALRGTVCFDGETTGSRLPPRSRDVLPAPPGPFSAARRQSGDGDPARIAGRLRSLAPLRIQTEQPSGLACATPRSVMMPVTSRAGVTSKAGLATGLPGRPPARWRSRHPR